MIFYVFLSSILKIRILIKQKIRYPIGSQTTIHLLKTYKIKQLFNDKIFEFCNIISFRKLELFPVMQAKFIKEQKNAAAVKISLFDFSIFKFPQTEITGSGQFIKNSIRNYFLPLPVST